MSIGPLSRDLFEIPVFFIKSVHVGMIVGSNKDSLKSVVSLGDDYFVNAICIKLVIAV